MFTAEDNQEVFFAVATGAADLDSLHFCPDGVEIKIRLRQAVAANLPPAGWI